MIINIGEEGKYPSEQLSNFTKQAFEIDGINCVSMEGFLQSLKFQDLEKQKEICQLWGGNAKKKGSKKNKVWKKSQQLNWLGKVYPRESEEYSKLIERAYKELGKNEIYKRYLLDAGLKELRHDYGRQEKAETVLTEKEFCDNLIKLRTEIREAKIKENKERIKEMDSVSNKIKEEVKSVLEGIEYIPDVFETGRNTIQIEYEKPNEEYLEFEFYENKVACYSVIKENGKKFEIEFVIEKEEIIGAIEKFFIN